MFFISYAESSRIITLYNMITQNVSRYHCTERSGVVAPNKGFVNQMSKKGVEGLGHWELPPLVNSVTLLFRPVSALILALI